MILIITCVDNFFSCHLLIVFQNHLLIVFVDNYCLLSFGEIAQKNLQ